MFAKLFLLLSVASTLLLGGVQAMAPKQRVLITGASGKVGTLIFKRLLTSDKFEPVGVVRSEKAQRKVASLGGPKENVIVCDYTDEEQLCKAFEGCDKLIMCTSARPAPKIWSIVKSVNSRLFGVKKDIEFAYPENQQPYDVDYVRALHQVNAAKQTQIKHFVFLSSMGGTMSDHFMNRMAREEGNEKTGNILLWKSRAEEYMKASKIPYTAIHCGGLLNDKGNQGKIEVGINDELLKREQRRISREDVAELCIQSLSHPDAINTSFDVIGPISKEPVPPYDWKTIFAEAARIGGGK